MSPFGYRKQWWDARYFIDHFLSIWHKPRKRLISRRVDRGMLPTAAVSNRQRSVAACSGNKLPPVCPGARPGGWEKIMDSLDSFKCLRPLKVGSKTYAYYSLPIAEKNGLKGISRLPYSMKVLLENLLRNEDGRTVKKEDLLAVADWLKERKLEHEIAFRPARVLMQDFTGVPAVVDLAAMRNAMQKLGGDAEKINPLSPVDLVIDHSVMVDHYGEKNAFKENVEVEMER